MQISNHVLTLMRFVTVFNKYPLFHSLSSVVGAVESMNRLALLFTLLLITFFFSLIELSTKIRIYEKTD